MTSIPYETVAAFMSKPSVLEKDQIKHAPYVLGTRDLHVVMANGDTVYARGFTAPVELGSHYNLVRVGEALRDPDDNRLLGYNGVYTGSGHVTRVGDPATLIMTDSTRETYPGDKLFPGTVDVPLDFIPSPPRTKIDGRIIAVSDGVTVIGQYQVVVVNRGARDGLVPGNVLAVFGVGGTVRDNIKHGFLTGVSRLFAKNVRLPDERTGTFMVFKTFDRMSYGLIMEATDIISVLRQSRKPVGAREAPRRAQISALTRVFRGVLGAAGATIRRMMLSEDVLAWVQLARAPGLDSSALEAALELWGPRTPSSRHLRRSSNAPASLRRRGLSAQRPFSERGGAALARRCTPSPAALHGSALPACCCMRSPTARSHYTWRAISRFCAIRSSPWSAAATPLPREAIRRSNSRNILQSAAWESSAGWLRASTRLRIAAHWPRKESLSRCSAAGSMSIYPRGHRDLSEAIAQQGALLSEFPLGTAPRRGNFPQPQPHHRRIESRDLGGRGGAQERLPDHRRAGPMSSAGRCSRFRDRSTIP